MHNSRMDEFFKLLDNAIMDVLITKEDTRERTEQAGAKLEELEKRLEALK